MSVLVKDLKPGITLMTLNRPDKRNPLCDQTISELVAGLKKCESDENCRVILLTGSGKGFSSGGDIEAMKKREEMFAGDSYELKSRYQAGIQQIPLTIEAMTKPIIALVQGAAIGAGCDLACMCDLRLGTKNAKFGETFSKLGLVPGDGGTYFLPRVVGYARALEMNLTGEIVGAEKAYQWGLLNALIEDDEELIEHGVLWAERIMTSGAQSLGLTKKALRRTYRESLADHLELISAYQGIAQRSSEYESLLDKVFKQ